MPFECIRQVVEHVNNEIQIMRLKPTDLLLYRTVNRLTALRVEFMIVR